MSERRDDRPRPRLKKETLRGLGFAELDAVRGGRQDDTIPGPGHGKPAASRFCLG